MMDWAGWIPIGIDWSGAQAEAVWFRLGQHRFDDAYFSETIARCARHPFNLVFARRTPIDTLEDAARSLPAAKVSGIVFHMSRCGSTLVSRSLAAVPGTLVISEAPPIDAIVRARLRDGAISEEQQVRWLRATVALFAAANGAHRHYVLKTDAWHAFNIALFERAFPESAWVFVYRDPVEVLVSHARRMSYMMSFANAPDFLGIPLTDAARIPREVYHAQVLARIASSVARHGVDPHALVRYDDLPRATEELIAPRFGMELSERERDAMRRCALYDAKQPGALFRDDKFAKQQAAHAAIRAAAATWVVPEIEHLDRVSARR